MEISVDPVDSNERVCTERIELPLQIDIAQPRQESGAQIRAAPQKIDTRGAHRGALSFHLAYLVYTDIISEYTAFAPKWKCEFASYQQAGN